jgi:hypothetical protein
MPVSQGAWRKDDRKKNTYRRILIGWLELFWDVQTGLEEFFQKFLPFR